MHSGGQVACLSLQCMGLFILFEYYKKGNYENCNYLVHVILSPLGMVLAAIGVVPYG